ncbi:ribonuclease H protein [Spatholobus suberectus]|nr:ribonuclease H protein [Spatholobus suberectus]
MFAALLYEVWQTRNSCIYNLSNFEPSIILQRARPNAMGFTVATAGIRDNTAQMHKHVTILANWYPPPIGWVKCNLDGSVVGSYTYLLEPLWWAGMVTSTSGKLISSLSQGFLDMRMKKWLRKEKHTSERSAFGS